MLRFTCLPKHVSNWLLVLRPMFRHRHHLVFCWLLVCQAIYQEKATLKGWFLKHKVAEAKTATGPK